MTEGTKKRKIAILGGGCGSMASALCLTSSPDWRDRFEITIYQMGWRLGGKGASGRNHLEGDRIEEHGLHVWGGFYRNAFAMMRGVYRELDREPDAGLSKLFDNGEKSAEGVPLGAFRPQHNVVLMDWICDRGKSKWAPWCIQFPADPYTWLDRSATGLSHFPGSDDAALPSALSMVQLLATYAYEEIRHHLSDTNLLRGLERADLPDTLDEALKSALVLWKPPKPDPGRKSSPDPVDLEAALTDVYGALQTFSVTRAAPPRSHWLDLANELAKYYDLPEDGPDKVAAWVALEGMKRLTLATALAQHLDESALRKQQREDPVSRTSPPQVLVEVAQNLRASALLFAMSTAYEVEVMIESGSLADKSQTAENAQAKRRLGHLMELVSAIVSGIVVDGIWLFGFESVDNLEFREWLERHRVLPDTLDSVCVMAAYDYAFGYRRGFIGDDGPNAVSPRGSDEEARLAAGTALKGTLQLVFGYQGAIFWKMQAGMGDAIFAPIYEVLEKRGVKFKFFHRVDALKLSDDQRRVERIEILEQVKTKSGGAYDPLVKVKGLNCWPSEPKFDDLDDELRKHPDRDLESIWNRWDCDHATLRTLERGEDFDDVVLGISIGDFPHSCRELIEASEYWRDMVDRISVNRTVSLQLWLARTTQELGWPNPEWEQCVDAEAPILTGFAHRLNTWADLTHLLDVENWKEWATREKKLEPRSLAYFCGPFEDINARCRITDSRRFREDCSIPSKALKDAIELAKTWTTKYCRELWPHHDLGKDTISKYLRVNISPSDLYVLSLPGTTATRLRAGESCFDNLYLAGDWVRTELNAGCVESAVMAGLDAARAIDPRVPRDFLHRLAYLAGEAAATSLGLASATVANATDVAKKTRGPFG